MAGGKGDGGEREEKTVGMNWKGGCATKEGREEEGQKGEEGRGEGRGGEGALGLVSVFTSYSQVVHVHRVMLAVVTRFILHANSEGCVGDFLAGE